MRYLQGTKDFMLTYKRTNNLEVVGYIDSDFIVCTDSKKSSFGYIFLVVEGAILWRSVKQSLVATSTMKAEFMACYDDTSQVLWLRNFIKGLQVVNNILRPLKIYCDSTFLIRFSKNNKSSCSFKHIEIKHLFINERIQKHYASIKSISKKFMIADPLEDYVVHMGLVSSLLLYGYF